MSGRNHWCGRLYYVGDKTYHYVMCCVNLVYFGIIADIFNVYI